MNKVVPILSRSLRFSSQTPFRVGVFMGSFNPIHNGHLQMAQKAAESLDAVDIVALAKPTHKPSEFMTDEVRHHLNTLAVSGLPKLRASRADIDNPSPTYAQMLQQYPDNPLHAKIKLYLARTLQVLAATREYYEKLTNRPVELTYLAGADGMGGYPDAWAEPEFHDFARQVTFAVADRPGSSAVDKVMAKIKAVVPHIKHTLLPMVLNPISSTEIRTRMAVGQPVTADLTPQPVADYLNQGGHQLLVKQSA